MYCDFVNNHFICIFESNSSFILPTSCLICLENLSSKSINCYFNIPDYFTMTSCTVGSDSSESSSFYVKSSLNEATARMYSNTFSFCFSMIFISENMSCISFILALKVPWMDSIIRCPDPFPFGLTYKWA